jgi:hypothetical protein
MCKYYVYVFLDESNPGIFEYGDIKFDYEPFYIGKGTGGRISSSLLDRESPFKVNKINKIKRSGFQILRFKLLENLENEEALQKEIEFIKLIGRRDLKLGPLVNQTDGGDGRSNIIVSKETREKIREGNIKSNQIRKILGTDKHTPEVIDHLRKINQGENNPFFGKRHTEEVKEEQSLRVAGTSHPMWGKKHNDITIEKIKKKINSYVDKEKIIKLSKERNSKSVIQFTLGGEFIQEFSSIKEASQTTGCSESIIGKCCRGYIKNPRSFIFKFKDNNSLELKNSYKIKIGDDFELGGSFYKLIKRNKSSAIGEMGGKLFTFRKGKFPNLFEKVKIVVDLN